MRYRDFGSWYSYLYPRNILSMSLYCINGKSSHTSLTSDVLWGQADQPISDNAISAVVLIRLASSKVSECPIRGYATKLAKLIHTFDHHDVPFPVWDGMSSYFRNVLRVLLFWSSGHINGFIMSIRPSLLPTWM